jgi:hypothetical protein
LQQFKLAAGQALAQDLLQRLESHAPQACTNNSFELPATPRFGGHGS